MRTAALMLGALVLGAGCAGKDTGSSPLEALVDRAAGDAGAAATNVALVPPAKLHERIDGMAPRYAEAGYRLGVYATLALGDGGSVELAIYDMTTPQGAAAVFEPPPPEASRALPGGVRAYAGPEVVEFAAGRYYVQLRARRDPAGRPTEPMIAMAEAVARAIHEEEAP